MNGGAAPGSPACNPVIAQTVSYKWSVVALPAGSQAQLNNPTGTNPSFTPDVAGTYTMQLVATDQGGLSSTPVAQAITVAACGNKAPVVSSIGTVGAPLVNGAPTVNPGATVSLTAVPFDADNGCLPSGQKQTFTYAWLLASRPSGSAAFIVNPTTDPTISGGEANFKPDVANGTYQAQLVITDSTGLKSPPAFISIFTNSCGSNTPLIDSASSNFASPDPGTTAQPSQPAPGPATTASTAQSNPAPVSVRAARATASATSGVTSCAPCCGS